MVLLIKLSHEYREIARENNAAAHRFTSELPNGDPERERLKNIALTLVAARRTGNAKIQELNGQGVTSAKAVREAMAPFVAQLESAVKGHNLDANTYYALTMTHVNEAARLMKED